MASVRCLHLPTPPCLRAPWYPQAGPHNRNCLPTLHLSYGAHTHLPHTHNTIAHHTLRSLHLKMVELARHRACDEFGPVHGDAYQPGRRVEGAALLDAQRAAIALDDLARRVDGSAAVAMALLDQVESACEGRVGGVSPLLPCFATSGKCGCPHELCPHELCPHELCEVVGFLEGAVFAFNAHPNPRL